MNPISPIHIIPFGGVGEMGMNLMLVRLGDAYLMVDCGIQFPDPADLGVERLIPNLNFLTEIKEKLQGIVLTHGHEDHIGALRWVLEECPVPILGTKFTLGLIREKLGELGMADDLQCLEIKPGEKRQFGAFNLRFLSVTHSIPGCVSVAIQTPFGHVLHTGDYRIDPNPPDEYCFDKVGFAELGEEGVALLLSDSTNALVPGRTTSESVVEENLRDLVGSWDKRVIVTMFSSNLYRLSSLYKIAQQYERTICTVGRSLQTYLRVGRDTTTLELPDPDKLPTLTETLGIPDSRKMIVCTGSQAEPRSALVQAASGNHKSFIIQPGDLVLFSSRVIPGNERRVARLINSLMRRGARCVVKNEAPIHASGHAKRDELAEMIQLTKPRIFVPIHGEYSFLQAHRELAEANGAERTRVVTNGDVLELGKASAKVVAKIDATPFYDDGAFVATAEEIKLNEKRRMAWNGVAVVYVRPEKSGGSRDYSVSIQSAGLFSDEGRLNEEAASEIRLGLLELPTGLPPETFKEEARILTRRFFRRRFSKKPIIFIRVENQ